MKIIINRQNENKTLRKTCVAVYLRIDSPYKDDDKKTRKCNTHAGGGEEGGTLTKEKYKEQKISGEKKSSSSGF